MTTRSEGGNPAPVSVPVSVPLPTPVCFCSASAPAPESGVEHWVHLTHVAVPGFAIFESSR